jgi:hypothetical protein
MWRNAKQTRKQIAKLCATVRTIFLQMEFLSFSRVFLPCPTRVDQKAAALRAHRLQVTVADDEDHSGADYAH